MPTKQMTYAELGAAWGITPEAARKRVEGLRLPRQPGNDGKARVTIDLDEVSARPPQPPSGRTLNSSGRRAGGDRPEVEALRRHVTSLLAEVERMAALAATNRADFEREREQAERAVADLTALAGRLADAERDRAAEHAEAERARRTIAKMEAERESLRHDLDAYTGEKTALKDQIHAWNAMPWWRRALARPG